MVVSDGFPVDGGQKILPIGVTVGVSFRDGAVFGGGQEIARRVDWAGSAGLPLSDSFPPCVVSALLTGQFAQSPVIYAAHCALICFISLIYLSGKVPSSE